MIARSSVITVSRMDWAYWVFCTCIKICDAELRDDTAMVIMMLIRSSVTIISTIVVPCFLRRISVIFHDPSPPSGVAESESELLLLPSSTASYI